jgi:hypothetical protein
MISSVNIKEKRQVTFSNPAPTARSRSRRIEARGEPSRRRTGGEERGEEAKGQMGKLLYYCFTVIATHRIMNIFPS